MAELKETPAPPPVTPQLLEEMTRRVVEGFDPDKVILFGSHAWGSPRPDSDVDLFVVMQSDLRPAQRSAQVHMACRPRFLPMDVIVRTPAELAHRLDIGDPFVRRIMKEGKVLYER